MLTRKESDPGAHFISDNFLDFLLLPEDPMKDSMSSGEYTQLVRNRDTALERSQ